MTNLEYIKTLDADKLAEILLSEDCPYCIHHSSCRSDYECGEGVLLWLQQEHKEEPKLVDANEIVKGIKKSTYCDIKYCSCDCSDSSNCLKAIINYVNALEEGEKMIVDEKLIEEMVRTYGIDNELIVCCEECSELTKEITKILRDMGNKSNLVEEMADVTICIHMLQKIFEISNFELQNKINEKEGRNERRLKNE